MIFSNDDDTNILFTFYVCGCDTIHSFIHTITHTHFTIILLFFFSIENILPKNLPANLILFISHRSIDWNWIRIDRVFLFSFLFFSRIKQCFILYHSYFHWFVERARERYRKIHYSHTEKREKNAYWTFDFVTIVDPKMLLLFVSIFNLKQQQQEFPVIYNQTNWKCTQ